MAVKRIDTIQNYSGLSGDTKPTAGVAVGSTFWETDSGTNNQYDGSDWSQIFPQIDNPITGALVILDIIHHRIHAGEYYTATYAEILASGSASILLMETAASAVADIHFLASLDTSAAGTVLFTEAPGSTVGTVVTVYNNLRESSNTATMTLTRDASVTTAGTILETGVLGGGASKKFGGASGSRNEWILNHNTRYSLEFVSSAATNVAWNVLWYEEEG